MNRKIKKIYFNIKIYSHLSQTSKNSCSIVISHPYYTSFTPTYIIVVIVVTAVVTVITHYIHPYYNCLPNLVIYHQSIIPTCTAISHPYLHTIISHPYLHTYIVVTVVVVTHIAQLLLLMMLMMFVQRYANFYYCSLINKSRKTFYKIKFRFCASSCIEDIFYSKQNQS